MRFLTPLELIAVSGGTICGTLEDVQAYPRSRMREVHTFAVQDGLGMAGVSLVVAFAVKGMLAGVSALTASVLLNIAAGAGLYQYYKRRENYMRYYL